MKRMACHSFQVLDGDLILLQGQEVLTFQQASARAGLVDDHSRGSDGQNGAGGHGNGASEEDLTGLEDRRYFMPTKSDRPIKAFREWVKEFGNGGPRWPVGFRTVPDVLGDRPEVILDRFTQVSAADTVILDRFTQDSAADTVILAGLHRSVLLTQLFWTGLHRSVLLTQLFWTRLHRSVLLTQLFWTGLHRSVLLTQN
jgi:hypothetical protein